MSSTGELHQQIHIEHRPIIEVTHIIYRVHFELSRQNSLKTPSSITHVPFLTTCD